jgi:predicted GIY-YIG superfamily endonuclease
MIITGDKYNRCIYSYEFPDNHVYVGLTCNLIRRQYDRNSDSGDSVTRYINESGLIPIRKQLTEYIPVKDAIKMELKILNDYVDKGWIALNRIKTGGTGSSRFFVS